MPRTGTQATDDYYTAEYTAKLTGRPIAMIYRYIRQGIVKSVDDPEDGRRKLIPWTETAAILAQPMRGLRKRRVQLTLPNGTVITKVIPMPVEAPKEDA